MKTLIVTISANFCMSLHLEFARRPLLDQKKPRCTGWFIFIRTVKDYFFGANGWFQVKFILWQILDHLNIFQLIYNHFLIWPTFDLKTASGLKKAKIKIVTITDLQYWISTVFMDQRFSSWTKTWISPNWI